MTGLLIVLGLFVALALALEPAHRRSRDVMGTPQPSSTLRRDRDRDRLLGDLVDRTPVRRNVHHVARSEHLALPRLRRHSAV